MKSVICSSSPVSRGAAVDPRAPASRQRRPRRAVGLRRQLSCPIDSELAHVGALAVTLIASLRLAERVVGPGHVEYVVDDLEQHTQLCREAAERHCRRSSSTPPNSQHAQHRRPDQSAGLQLVQPPQSRPARGARWAHVGVLSADHPLHPGRRGELRRGPQHPLGRRARGGSADGERLRVQPVARRGSRRPRRTPRGRSAARGAARRRPSPAGRRGSASRCGSARSPPPAAAPAVLQAHRPGRREREHRADALAAGQQRVAHRLLQARRQRLLGEAHRSPGSAPPRSAGARGRRLQALTTRPALQQGVLAGRGGGAPRRARSCSSSAAACVASAAHSSTIVAAASAESSPERSCSAARSRRAISSSRDPSLAHEIARILPHFAQHRRQHPVDERRGLRAAERLRALAPPPRSPPPAGSASRRAPRPGAASRSAPPA